MPGECYDGTENCQCDNEYELILQCVRLLCFCHFITFFYMFAGAWIKAREAWQLSSRWKRYIFFYHDPIHGRMKPCLQLREIYGEMPGECYDGTENCQCDNE